jgi:hypothetical protein
MLHNVSWKQHSILAARISQIRKQRKTNPLLGTLSSMVWYVFEYLICLEFFLAYFAKKKCFSWLLFFTYSGPGV